MVDKIGCPFKQNSCRQLHALHSSKKSISVGRFEGQPFRQHPHTSPSEHVGIKRNGGDSHPFSRRPRSCSRKGILCVKLNSQNGAIASKRFSSPLLLKEAKTCRSPIPVHVSSTILSSKI
ncbi:uncharacterized protein LOC116926364 [Daphnia magna]|uniref:uncharacterized protein LOC116926364 n=1 Tax=Daphnia magna TaxID=35525 RepID=UPI001E1BDB02|nr:uncharacterized protein LOC116926364 [Daphnia magna]